MSASSEPQQPQEDRELLTFKHFNEEADRLTFANVVELMHFIMENGYMSYEFHEPIHELVWKWKVYLDFKVPGWTRESLKDLVKEIRYAQEKLPS